MMSPSQMAKRYPRAAKKRRVMKKWEAAYKKWVLAPVDRAFAESHRVFVGHSIGEPMRMWVRAGYVLAIVRDVTYPLCEPIVEIPVFPLTRTIVTADIYEDLLADANFNDVVKCST